MSLKVDLFKNSQKQRRQKLYELIFKKQMTLNSIKNKLKSFLENSNDRNIKRKIKNDLEFLNQQFEFRKRTSMKTKRASIKIKRTSLQTGGFKFPRKWSKAYCKKTSCKKMGFSQRSSCRPYKNCFK